MKEITINTLQELAPFAKSFAKELKPGCVVCLSGDLGAGKTTFVQLIAKEFSIKEQVPSPTFNILLQYKNGDTVLNHFDIYRLEKPEELEDIGFYETIESNAFSFVEWAEKFKDQMPEQAIWVKIEKGSEDSRKITVS